MNRQTVIEQQLVDRYVRNKLSEEQAAEFEAFYMDDEETLDDLETLAQLQQSMREGYPKKPQPKANARHHNPGLRWWQAGGLAIAASVLTAVGLQNFTTIPTQPNIAIVDFPITRSTPDAVEISADSTGDYVVVRVSLLVDDLTEPVIAEIHRDGNVVRTVTGLNVNSFGDVQFGLPIGELSSGEYRLVLSRDNAGVVDERVFRILP